MLYSKNGSIPYPTKDDTEGWIEVADKPEAPEGKEVVWWFPPGWVIRDPMPVNENFVYSWSQSEEKWIEHVSLTIESDSTQQEVVITTEETPVSFTENSSMETASLTTTDIISALQSQPITALTGDV